MTDLKDQRIQVLMSEAELQLLDDWSFAKKIRSRGEAIRKLCRVGMAIEPHLKTVLDDSFDALQELGRIHENIVEVTKRADGAPPSETVSADVALDAVLAMYRHLHTLAANLGLMETATENLISFPDLKSAQEAIDVHAKKLQEILDDSED